MRFRRPNPGRMIESRARGDASRLIATGLMVPEELGEHHVAEHQPAQRGKDEVGLRTLVPMRGQNFERTPRDRDAWRSWPSSGSPGRSKHAPRSTSAEGHLAVGVVYTKGHSE
jgi:hypothetical protein